MLGREAAALPILVKDRQGRTLPDVSIRTTVSPSSLGSWQDGVFSAGLPGIGKLEIEAGGVRASVQVYVTTGVATNITVQDFSVKTADAVNVPIEVTDPLGNVIEGVEFSVWTEPDSLGTWADGVFIAGTTPQSGHLIIVCGDLRKHVSVIVLP